MYTEANYAKLATNNLVKRLMSPSEKDDTEALKRVLATKGFKDFTPEGLQAYLDANTLDLSAPAGGAPAGKEKKVKAEKVLKEKKVKEPKAPREPKETGPVNYQRDIDFGVTDGGDEFQIGTKVETFVSASDPNGLAEGIIYQFWRRGTGPWSADVKFGDGKKVGRKLSAIKFVEARPEGYVTQPRTRKTPTVVVVAEGNENAAPAEVDTDNANDGINQE